jgi:hypothetical protein
MPIPSDFTIQAKPAAEQSRDSFMEFARLKGSYLFDEVYVKSISHHPNGVEISFDYERQGNRMRDVPSCIVSGQDWADSRQKGDVVGTKEDKRNAFSKTPVVARLFAEGARHYNNKNQSAEADFAADLNFLNDIGRGN